MINLIPNHSYNFGNTLIQIYHANPGEGLIKHEHTFKHATICLTGKIVVRKENKEVILDKNSRAVMLKENEWHEIEALEEGTVFQNVVPK